MKRKILYMFFISVLLLLFTSCDFIQYKKHTPVDTELLELKENYIEKLNDLSSLENYREAEQRIYTLALQEAVNQINDCKDKILLEEIFNANKEIILNIKLDETYRLEEEQLRQEYIQKLQSISNEEAYQEEEKEIYLYYLNLGIEALKENTNAENFKEIYSAYEARIKEIKTLEQYVNEWHMSFCLEIDAYVDLTLYREAEATALSNLILSSKEQILDTESHQDMDTIIRDFKIKVYTYPTDRELYALELETLKEESINEIQNYKVLEEYRDNEQSIVLALIETFNKLVLELESKENVVLLCEQYKNNLDSIKTDKILYEEERLELVEENYKELLQLIDLTDKTEDFIASFNAFCLEVKEEMEALPTKQEVNVRYLNAKESIYIQGAQAGDLNSIKYYRNIVIGKVEQYLDLSLYRLEQQKESNDLIASWSFDLMQIEDYDSIVQEVQKIQQQLDEIPTNAELWTIEDEAFIERMQDKYKDQCLQFPKSLFEADDLYELAKIMDYYAFYQLDATSFERNKFRVRLNFEHKDARFVKNEVYWYCELLRSTVGLDVWFEEDDYFVVEYIPYDFASTNTRSITPSTVERKNSIMQINSGNWTNKRSDDFDDFAYYQYTKEIVVWNTQQLWYALQYEYVPICVPGSVAERTLNRAKEILREIVSDDMTLEEKIFSIFTWFGQNVDYDHQMYLYNDSSDMDAYPEEMVSQLTCFFAEGPLLDNLSVCSGYAKAYLILLRMEGIESYHILARCWALRGKNTINARDDGGFGGYGSHEFVYIRIGDKWYYSDAERSAAEADNSLQSYLYCLLPPSNQDYGFSVFFPELEWGEDIPEVYSQINIMGINNFVESIDDVKEIMDLIKDKEEKYQISILYNPNEYKNCYEDIASLLNEDQNIFF
ncbi:MAG: transglutaminase-like domain-containing protein, partial [Anaeroplasmataceae bacterium]|nr:transglutaminase-like domain-containing protein [Anaeroplasmataceae bacterium]